MLTVGILVIAAGLIIAGYLAFGIKKERLGEKAE